MVTHRVHRRGFALVDAIIGGALLARLELRLEVYADVARPLHDGLAEP